MSQQILTLGEFLKANDLKPLGFSKRLARRLGRRVPVQSVYRWARAPEHPLFSVPKPAVVVAIEEETAGAVPKEVWYRCVRGRRRRIAA